MSDQEQMSYRPRALVAPLAAAQQAGAVDHANDLLEGEGLGRPLEAPETVSSALALLPVTRDAREVVAKLRQLGGAGSLAGQVDIDPLLRAATVRDGAVDKPLYAVEAIGHDTTTDKNIGHSADKNIGHSADKNIGHSPGDGSVGPLKDIGHAKVAWVSVATGPRPPSWQSVAAGRRPVVALLDTGVAVHWWLGPNDPADPFMVDAAQYGWQPLNPLPAPPRTDLGSHHGHGTFSAGLIRQHAPTAKVLSIGLMSDTGLVSEVAVLSAIEWLTRWIVAGGPVDVVMMPFGRRETEGDNGLTRGQLGLALERLATHGTRIVAAVGSDGENRPTYPAAFAPVIGVGSGTPGGSHDAFSDHGGWVDQLAVGKDVVSILPVTTVEGASGYTRWSGTSFAAARHAATLVQPS